MEQLRRNHGLRIAVSLLAPVLILTAYWRSLVDMWQRWFPAWDRRDLSLYHRLVDGESYYTHGPLAIAVALLIVLLLLRRTRIEVRPKPKTGAAIMALSLLVHLGGNLARVNFVSAFSLIGALAGLIVMLWGVGAMRRLWFVLVMLAFAIPLPEVTIAGMNFRLKMIAAASGVKLANLLGMIAVRTGNRVFLAGDKTLVVANVCNGLRTLISLTAFGALYAYVCRLRGLWRLLLFAMVIPVAVACNALRVLALIAVADWFSVEAATGWFHDFSGLMIFAAALAMMFSLEKLILLFQRWTKLARPVQPLFHDVRLGEDDRGQGQRLAAALSSPRAIVAAVLLALTAGGVHYLHRAVEPALHAAQLTKVLPERLSINGLSLDGRDVPLDERTLVVLETPEYVYRRYREPNGQGDPLDFCLIFSRDNRKGIHPPDLCLEGAGQNIIAKNDVTIPGVPDLGDVPCRELLVENDRGRYYYIYTYKCGHDYTRSFWRQQLVIFSNGLFLRNAAGALIRASTPIRSGSLDEARENAWELFREVMPHVEKALP